MKVPAFPVSLELKEWNELLLLAATVFLEAEDQVDEGKLAVAYVVMNRAQKWNKTVQETILQPWQFSCWNLDYRTIALGRLARVGPHADMAWKAASSALWKLLPDPTHGSCHYLNPELTRRGRPNQDLPPWYEESKVVARIGSHEFLRLTET